MAVGVMATTAPCASTSVLERMTVMRPLPSSQRWASPQVNAARCDATPRQRGQPPGPGRTCSAQRPLGRLNAAAAATGLGGGEAYDGEHVGGKGAGA